MKELPWLTPKRAGSMPAGCAVLVAVLKWLERDAALISDRDLLDGVVMTM